MVYILETDITEKKSVKFSLQKIYGIGEKQSSLLCKKVGFSHNLQVGELSHEQKRQLIKMVEHSNLVITSELRKLRALFLTKLINTKTYRGLRKIRGLPVRGQRTHTNAKTAKKQKKFSNF